MLAVARAIVEPRALLLIDEPSKGLAPSIISNLISAFRELKRQRTTILLVEQNFHDGAGRSATAVAVMDNGRGRAHRLDGASWPTTKRCSSGCSGLSLGVHQ